MSKIFCNRIRINILQSFFVLFISFLILFFIVRFRPLFGDDVLFLFEKALSVYTDEDFELGEYVATFPQVKSNFQDLYFNFSGRILPGIIFSFMPMLCLNTNAIIVCIIYFSIVIIILHLIYGKKFLQYPSTMAFIILLFISYNHSMASCIMRVIATHYGVPCMLYLLFGDIVKNAYTKCVNTRDLLVINIIGLLAGISHELLGIWFILWIIFLLNEPEGTGKLEKKYFYGWLLGYVSVLSAPGIYKRLMSPHDASIWGPLFPRLLRSVDVHMVSFQPCETIGKIIFSIIVTFVCVCVVRALYKKDYATLFYVFEGLCLTAISVVFWGVVSYVPEYGIMGTYIIVIISCIKLINNSGREIRALFKGICILLFLCSLVDMCTWIPCMVRQSIQREKIIHEAVLNGANEVHIPAFSNNVRKRRVMYVKYSDSDDKLGEKWYLKYYGIRIFIDRY